MAPAGVTRSPVPSTSAAVPARKKGTSDPRLRASLSQSFGGGGPKGAHRCAQHGGRVAGAAAKARLHRDPLRQKHAHRRQRAARALERLHGEIALVGELAAIAVEAEGGSGLEGQLVGQVERHHHAAYAVVPVAAPGEHFERQVDFRGCFQSAFRWPFREEAPCDECRSRKEADGLAYDAQRNEFCAYVLNESETPYGLLLGNYKTYAQSTAKGGVRGLWDADTDQIIFGTHHIAYRISDRTFFPTRSNASSPFSRTRRYPSSRSTTACT